MSKYIRTKDGIYEAIINTFEHSWGEISWSVGKTRGYANNKEEYEKQINELRLADTIEELCDQYVFTSPELKHPELVIKMNFEYVKQTYKYTEFYGAIWTDKGLIYVAKLNEKGELELI